MMREEILHQKLNSLQNFIDQAKETSENGWLVSHKPALTANKIYFIPLNPVNFYKSRP